MSLKVYNSGMQSSRIGNHTIWYNNREEWRIVKKEVFTDHVYYIEIEKENPKIIDLGAYIGDTVIYFKKLYPRARIVAVEPLPENLKLLRKNIAENQLMDVEIVEGAVTARGGEVDIFSDINPNGWTSMAGVHKGGWGGQQKSKSMKAKSIKLDDLLDEQVDLVKMDIEGAEGAVLAKSKKLDKVRNFIIEYHPVRGNKEIELVKQLENREFEVEVRDDPEGWGEGLKIIRASRV